MTNMVTRCPQCSTSFRITPTQIQKARGAVRCGSCLHIFKAQEHLVQATNAPTAGATQAKPKKVASKKPATPAPQQETLDIPAQPKAQATTQPTKNTEAPQASAPAKPSPAVEIAPEQPKAPEPKPQESTLAFDQSQIDSESGDDDMLISDDMEKDREHDDSDSFYIEPTRKRQSLFEGKETALAEDFSDASDESWADELLTDTPYESAIIDEPTPKPSAVSEVKPVEDKTETDTETKPTAPETEEAATTTDEPPKASSDSRIQAQRDDEDLYGESLNAFDHERSGFILNIDPEPVEMTIADSTPWYQRSHWGILSVLAVILLISQVAYLQFDQLSRIQPYRGYYQTACAIFKCQLPTLVDRHKIQAYNLVVRNHPELENTLLVDAIIINKAAFNQPFPALALEFSDIKGRPVSARQFKPSEYLHGELRGVAIMPQNQPIHINLEIVDPGEHAVNYRIYTP